MKALKTYGRSQALLDAAWKPAEHIFDDTDSSGSDVSKCENPGSSFSAFDRLLKETNFDSPKNCRRSQFKKVKRSTYKKSEFAANKSSSEASDSHSSPDFVAFTPVKPRSPEMSLRKEKIPARKNERGKNKKKQKIISTKENTQVEDETLVNSDNSDLALKTPYPDFSAIEKWSLVFVDDSITENKKGKKQKKKKTRSSKKSVKRLHDPIQNKSFSPVLTECKTNAYDSSVQKDNADKGKIEISTPAKHATVTEVSTVFRYPTRRALKARNEITFRNPATSKKRGVLSKQALPNDTSVDATESNDLTCESLKRKISALIPKRPALSPLNSFSPIGCSEPQKTVFIETSTPFTQTKQKSTIKKKSSFHKKLDESDSCSSPSLDMSHNCTVLSLYKAPIFQINNENTITAESSSTLSDSAEETIVMRRSALKSMNLGKRRSSFESDYSGTLKSLMKSSDSVTCGLRSNSKKMKSNDETKLSKKEPIRMQTRYMLNQTRPVRTTTVNTRLRSKGSFQRSSRRVDSPNITSISTVSVVRGNAYKEMRNYRYSSTDSKSSNSTSTSEKDLEKSSLLLKTRLTAYKNRRIDISNDCSKANSVLCNASHSSGNLKELNTDPKQCISLLASLSCFIENNELEDDGVHNISTSQYISPRKSISPENKIYELCNQSGPMTFMEAIPRRMMQKCKKLGEGVFGEVFGTINLDRKSVAIKIVPVEGDFLVNGEKQKKFMDIATEIVISKELTALSCGENNRTNNFTHLNRVMCVRDKYPAKLISEWDIYSRHVKTENERPCIFPETQFFIVFEFLNGGKDLEAYEFNSALQSLSVFYQTASALAVAESELEFEHRDLHWGNILIGETKQERVGYVLNGLKYTYPTFGVHVNIIDFTLARLTKDGCDVYCDYADDDSLFTGSGDFQFEVYRLMREHNGNDWKKFCPYTNVLWLSYLLDKLLHNSVYKNSTSKEHQSAYRILEDAYKSILCFKSSTHFILENDFVEIEFSPV